ncbi:MAG TPA: hypothetical protein VLE93_01815 [Candidatus Saccharimonadales bacterium]|nr:hypothetical protein [Candidatus Saccharimonadales bacterium]
MRNKDFPPLVRFERIVCAFIIHPRTHRVLTVRMDGNAKPPSKLSKGTERHLPGGNVKHNQTPEVAIRHQLLDKLNITVEKVHEFMTMVRSGTLKDPNGEPVLGGKVFVTTYWYIIEPAEQSLANIRVNPGFDLMVESELWSEFHQLIDGDSEHCLGATAGERTPYLDIQPIWPYGHSYQKHEAPREQIGLQQAKHD